MMSGGIGKKKMGRAQDLLEKAMQNIKELSNNADFSDRCNDGLSKRNRIRLD